MYEGRFDECAIIGDEYMKFYDECNILLHFDKIVCFILVV